MLSVWFTTLVFHFHILENWVKVYFFLFQKKIHYGQKIGVISNQFLWYILILASIQNSDTKLRFLFIYALFTQKLVTLKMHFFPDTYELHFTKTIFMVVAWEHSSPYLRLIWSFLTQGSNRWVLDKGIHQVIIECIYKKTAFHFGL